MRRKRRGIRRRRGRSRPKVSACNNSSDKEEHYSRLSFVKLGVDILKISASAFPYFPTPLLPEKQYALFFVV
jgi:hypothetical protein